MDSNSQKAVKTSIQFVNKLKKTGDPENSIKIEKMQKALEPMQLTVNDLKSKVENLEHYRKRHSLSESFSQLFSANESIRSSRTEYSMDAEPDYVADHSTKCPFIQYVYKMNTDGSVDLFKTFQQMFFDKKQGL